MSVPVPVRVHCSCGLVMYPNPEAAMRGISSLTCRHCDRLCLVKVATCELCKVTMRTVRNG